jgi:hypothetical protein
MNPHLRRSAVSIAGLFLMAVLIACACGGSGLGGLLPTATPAATATLPPTEVPPTNTPAPTAADPTEAPEGDTIVLDGNYAVAGTNPDGSEYEGDMTITTVGDVYEVVWQIAGNTDVGTGVGFGEYLAVGFPNDLCSTAIYVAIEDTLIGLWAAPNSTTLNSESATWLNPDDESGVLSFTVEGTNPDGSTYTGGMALTRVGDLFTVAQSIGDVALTGTGIFDDQDGVFAVAYGETEGCGISYFKVTDDGVLSGQWGIFGQNDNLIGTETAVRY